MSDLFELGKKWLKKYNTGQPLNIMEVCGTHTMAISRYGLRQLLPPNINLISGPGCPVCVTSAYDIDLIMEIINNYDLNLFTFGDMIRVPGSSSSLLEQKSRGKKITVCYSPLDALNFAIHNPDQSVLFIAIGFETTTPLSSIVIKRAEENQVRNFFIFSTHKLVPPALELLVKDKQVKIDGFLCPGHVSAIIGSRPYHFIPLEYGIPCVVSGFEPTDILLSIAMILRQIYQGKPSVEIQYKTVVKPEGNRVAIDNIYDVFQPVDCLWRGLGNMPCSGLELKPEYQRFNARLRFPVPEIKPRPHPGCVCGEVLKGLLKPNQCRLFGQPCTPQNPIGPCMVSSEGSCAAYYRYERLNPERI